MLYRWRLTAGSVITEVYPVYKDDIALNYELESGQRFFRSKLSSKIDFVGADADIIINADFNTEFILDIRSSANYGVTWSLFHTCHFYKTDCTINEDDKKVTVQPQIIDKYTKILDGWEREYNLIDLLPVTERVTLKKRALLQLYAGDGKVTNIFGGFSWEEDFDIGNGDPEATYHFHNNLDICSIKVDRFFVPPSERVGLEKSFIAQPDANGEFETTNGEGVYKLVRVKVDGWWHLRIIRLSDDVIVANYVNNNILLPTTEDILFQDYQQISPEEWGRGVCKYYAIYARWLCDVTSVTISGQSPQETLPLTSNDPSYGGNLHYVIGADVSIVSSNNLSATATKWGKFDDTYYYDRPTEQGYFIPIARSYWSIASFWYKQRNNEYLYEEPAMQKSYELRDSYPLWSVLAVLLQANDTGVSFLPTTDYSEFLYSATNPVNNQQIGVPHITPKSNILVGEYTQPAMKAPITLHDVLDMLKKAYNCYWFIDEYNHLRIEHISWFKNGGSYGGTHQIDVDLTARVVTRNGKPWSYGTNTWQFDKIEMPARYQYKWMDAGTDVFDGFPFEIQSPFVQTDKVEEITVSNFTSDLDYMQIAPENCSKDGFALLMVKNDGSGNYVPIVFNYRTQDGGTCYYQSQNFYAAMKYLQAHFLCYDLPTYDYICDSEQLTAPDIKRGKRQQVMIPYGNATPDTIKLIKTAMGDGQLQQLSLSLSSRMGKATLMYDTYENENNE